MSKCISQHGEYSEHEPDDDFVCALCGVLDEDGLIADRKRLAEQLAAAQAVIVEVAALPRYSVDDPVMSWSAVDAEDINGILAQSPTDALQAHDAQVRAEAKAEALREHAKRLRYWTRDESQKRLRFSVDNAVADLEEEAARIDRTTPTETTNGDSDE